MEHKWSTKELVTLVDVDDVLSLFIEITLQEMNESKAIASSNSLLCINDDLKNLLSWSSEQHSEA